jgi:hypothetical protein
MARRCAIDSASAPLTAGARTASVPRLENAPRRAHAIGELLQFRLFGTHVCISLRFVDTRYCRVGAEMLREVGDWGFHDVDSLYVARLRTVYASVQAIDMPPAIRSSIVAVRNALCPAEVP